MQVQKVSLLLGALFVWFTAPCVAIAGDDGASVFDDVCTGCHTPTKRPLDNVHQTAEQWKATIDKMVGLGADVPDKKIPALLDYLVRTHGPADAGGGGKN